MVELKRFQYYVGRPCFPRRWVWRNLEFSGDCSRGLGFPFGAVGVICSKESYNSLMGLCEQRKLPGCIWCGVGTCICNGSANWWRSCSKQLPMAFLHEPSFDCGRLGNCRTIYEPQEASRNDEREARANGLDW